MQVTVVDGNNVTVSLDRGVAGVGIASISLVVINQANYLLITYTNGTTQTVGPVGVIQYNATTPINISGSTISLLTVPVNLGGTGQTTAAAGLNALLPAQTSQANKYLQTDGTNASWDAVSLSTADITGILPVANGGTGVSTSTGTGNTVLSTSPTLVTPNLGTPSFLLGTNITGTAAGLTAGTVTTNANLTGDVTSVGNATTLATVATAGTTGSSTAIPVITINAKGLTTSITTAVVIAPAGTLSGSTLASGVTASSLTSLGTITSLVVTAGTISTTPSGSTDIANKSYVDTVAQGLDTKASVVAGTTANISLTGAQTIDGVSVVATDRVLVKNQTAPAENGIYVASATAWTRATDMNTWVQVPGAYVFVETGTTLADTGWVCTSNAGGTINVTAMTWAQFSGAGSGVSSITFGTTGLTPSTTTTGAVTVAGTLAVANGGTGLSSGTSGGVLAYTATGTLASSAALAASALVIGGGAGAAPSTTTTGTGVVTALGVNVGSAGAFVVNGGALGSPSSVGTMPAFTLGGTVSGGGNNINNVVIGASSPLAGNFSTLSASGQGAINSAIATNSTFQVAGTYAGTGGLFDGGLYVNVDGGTMGVNRTISQSYFGYGPDNAASTITTAASGTNDISTITIFPYVITSGGATLTDSTTLAINDAPNLGTNKRALWVKAGMSQLDGGLAVTGTVSATPGSVGAPAYKASLAGTIAGQAGFQVDYTIASNNPGIVINQTFAGGSGATSSSLLQIDNRTTINNSVYIHNNAATPFVIDSSGNVGIGTSSPAQSLDTTGKIRVRDGGNTTVPSIQMGSTGVDGFSLPSTNTIAFITNSLERARIDSSGNVVLGSSANGGQVMTTLQGYSTNSTNGSYGNLLFSANANYTGGASRFLLTNAFNATDFAIISSVNPTTTPTLDSGGAVSSGTAVFSLSGGGNAVFAGNITISNGNLIVGTAGKGIDFSATSSGSGTMTSELLADYEEGTWTPTDNSGAGLSFTVYDAAYTKVGRLVEVQASITYPSTASASDAKIAGLPFTSASGTDNTGGICFSATNANLNFTGLIARNNTSFFLETITGASVTNLNMSTKYIKFFGWYYV